MKEDQIRDGSERLRVLSVPPAPPQFHDGLFAEPAAMQPTGVHSWTVGRFDQQRWRSVANGGLRSLTTPTQKRPSHPYDSLIERLIRSQPAESDAVGARSPKPYVRIYRFHAKNRSPHPLQRHG